MSLCAMKCGTKLADRARKKTCPGCRSNMGFWTNHRSVAERMKYTEKLELRQRRMANVLKGKDKRVW